MSGKGKGKLNGVVIIDVDGDDYDDTILIHAPESFRQRFRGPRVTPNARNYSFKSVITLDDDDDIMPPRDPIADAKAEEEARILRKRTHDESIRLDMERRQKLRIEEVRETNKKDDEYKDQKEQLRAVVKENLKKMEKTSIDLASMLCSLGIPVGGPSPAEVNAAYKRAFLKFHPDRATRMNAQQQVEAEEKFKLICRMKEKFLSK
ncbi:hypothetical protein ACFE04_028302 [Oxalis oulophora]